LNEQEFVTKVSVLVIKKYLPIALTAAAKNASPEHKKALEEAATLCSLDPSIENAKKAKTTAYASAASAASAAAYAAYAAYAASAAAADAAADADAAYAYAYAASAAYAAYAYAYAYAAADATKRDSVLAEFGEDVVQILIEMKAPGTAFLYLTEPSEAALTEIN
jgi:hypothetical protein